MSQKKNKPVNGQVRIPNRRRHDQALSNPIVQRPLRTRTWRTPKSRLEIRRRPIKGQIRRGFAAAGRHLQVCRRLTDSSFPKCSPIRRRFRNEAQSCRSSLLHGSFQPHAICKAVRELSTYPPSIEISHPPTYRKDDDRPLL